MPQWTDFVADFMQFTTDALSPDIFRRWSAIAAIAGAMERRIWSRQGPRVVFPNLYTLLVAPPGVGKFTIEEVRGLWTEAKMPGTREKAFQVAPDSMTKATLMDNLVKAKTTRLMPSGPPYTYHSMLVAAEEFSVLLPSYDLEYIGSLNSIYNNKVLHAESRRTGSVRELSIEFPQINLLGGVQPGWLSSVFPEEAWSTGLTSRIIMIYSSDLPLKDIYADTEGDPNQRDQLVNRLGQVAALVGEMSFAGDAMDRLRRWHLAGSPPAPTHSKLVNYVRRRSLHVQKLAMISAIARTGRLRIELLDTERAIGWLLEVEKLMPDIFRAMIGRSDIHILEELHRYVMGIWSKDKKASPVTTADISWFLSDRAPSDKVLALLMNAERSGLIVRVGGTQDLWLPGAKFKREVE